MGETKPENAMKVALVGLAVPVRVTIARGRLIRNGACWSGGDLTAESIDRVRTRSALRGLPYDELRQGSVIGLPFTDDTFDIVLSHGGLSSALSTAVVRDSDGRNLRRSSRWRLFLKGLGW